MAKSDDQHCFAPCNYSKRLGRLSNTRLQCFVVRVEERIVHGPRVYVVDCPASLSAALIYHVQNCLSYDLDYYYDFVW